MRALLKGILFIVLCNLSFNVFAAKDPVLWRLNKAFHNPSLTGRTYTVTYTFTSQLPFTMVRPLVIEKNATPAGDFSYSDTCTGMRLTPNQSCTVQVTLTPQSVGTKFLQLAITGYDSNRVLLPALTTQTRGESLQTVYGTVTQSLPATMNVSQTGNYTFSFTNNSSATVTDVAVEVTQTSGTPSFTTNCLSTLGQNKTCTITGSYTPLSDSPTVQGVTGKFNYAQGSTVSLSTNTSVSTASGVTASFVGNNYLPAEMVGGSSNIKTIWYLFTNHTGGSITISSSSVDVSPGSEGTFTVDSDPALNNCSGTLANDASCQIKGTFEGNVVASPTQVDVTGEINYTGGGGTSADITTSTTLVATMGTSRTLTLVNNCSFPVWFSLNGGALGGSPSCPNSPCPTGTTCNSTTHTCFWNNYAPNTGTYELAQSGGTTTVTIPLTSADPAIQWSGNISASTGCNGTTCKEATCQNSGGTTACAPGIGFSQPATQAEITMSKTTSDSYDVEVINGFHIPIAMAPGPYVTPNNYTCGVPGSFTAGNGFGACNWETAALPGNGYYWVSSGGTPCNISAPTCGSETTQICGLDSNLNQVCGDFLGYWTANQVCSKNNVPSAVSSYFNCSEALSSLTSTIPFPSNSTLYDLMACAVPTGDTLPPFNTCYKSYPGSTSTEIQQCCGCVDWWTISGIGSNPNAQSCTQAGQSSPQSDPVWTQYIQPGVQWLKKACPSLYTYQFDDATSGFSCTNTLPGEANSVGYTITFCQGNTGLPAGKADGRGV